ncbi:MAG: glycosyltransferase [Synergistaceae bacterium]|jgi:glycosyltransferase involved in cell wall biosynthesis|nr:glycosyltransferase [Synergistaceae bacterium]
MISVVIATLNRAEALENISLKSLLKQDCGKLEAIVWDASDGDGSRDLCLTMSQKFNEKGFLLRYFKAPRRGLASQRNDAVKMAVGDIIFFIDDDCEVPTDGISSLSTCFDSYDWLPGASLPLLNKTTAAGNSAIKAFATLLFGSKNKSMKRLVSKAGGLSLPIKDLPGLAEWLSGGTMAFRKFVFDRLKFDERLQIFGGYSLGEDVDFSHRVMLEFGQPLMVARGGFVVHRAEPGSRLRGSARAAAFFYNPALIRRNFKEYGKRFGFLHCAWGSIGTVLYLLFVGCSPLDILRGAWMARQEMKKTKGSIRG